MPNRGIWKTSELQRLHAARGMTISAGKMSGLWSGQPNSVRLDELDVICAVLGCGSEEPLQPEPETVAEPKPDTKQQTAAVGEARSVAPRPKSGRTLPPR
ncbi:XRE family transcriptional regulator [Nocardiopsis gilva YIM 90087]|uniref:XRE family transcriptional regulator n=1 Tax=Nocardiopsis gilva YIM 90087 TaxID=1235441 RepID=A0A223S0V6_9ACTN|nr:XRE family transcriptional regulator [Nocardiopsis gilva YIM 90087]